MDVYITFCSLVSGTIREDGENRFQEHEVREAGVKIQCLLYVIGHGSHELIAAVVT